MRELCSCQKVLGGFSVSSETVCYPEALSVAVMVCIIINQAKQINYQMSEMFGLRKSVQTLVKLSLVTKIERVKN